MEYFMKFLNLSGSLICVISLLIFVDSTLIDYVEESCYGIGFEDRLQPNCSEDEIIYPHDVYTYTKKNDIGCPLTSDDSNRNEAYCCRYVNETEDCGMRYFGVDGALEHYLHFTGKALGSIQVAWNNTLNICNQSIYNSKTHYMRMTYNCIKSSHIMSMCNGSFTGKQAFLWNDGYPYSDGVCNSTSGCKCVIQSSGGSTIQIDALDLRFAQNETTGACAQRLFVIDGNSESDIACDDVNLFERRTLFTSSTDSIQLRYDNTYYGSTGSFWISAQVTATNQTLSILCSHSDNVDVDYSCGDNFTIISPLTTPSPTETSAIETSDTVTPTESTNDTLTPTESTSDTLTSTESLTQSTLASKSTGEESTSKGPIIGAIIGVVAALAGLIAYLLWRKKLKPSNQVDPDYDPDYDELFNNQDDIITSRPPERL